MTTTSTSHSHVGFTIILTSTIALAVSSTQAVGATSRQPDFNSDHYADLVLPVSGESLGSASAAGAVNVIYGSADGLKSAGNQFWNQNSSSIADTAEDDDWFGYAIAWGDFDADGYSDLAVSAPGENNNAGAVHVLYGSAAGLTGTGDQIWRQGANGLANTQAADEWFGLALAVGDFDGDGADDLAIGAPYQKVGGDDGAGAVHIIYGVVGVGLSSDGDDYWTQDSDGLASASAEYLDHFGWSLAAGDFNGDGRDDLAVGVPYENFASLNCGAVNILYGSASGLTSTGTQFIGQNSVGVSDSDEEDDYFGWSLAAGDFDGDGRDDLAVGAEGETLGGKVYAGAVHIIHGSATGLNPSDSQFWSQDSAGVAESVQNYDQFGSTLAAGDFDNDGVMDLAIGALDESVGSASYAGAVHVLFGSMNVGLTSSGSKLITQDSESIPDAAEQGDNFGSLLIIGDFDGDGRDDLAIGVPYENYAGMADTGVMHVLYGSADGTGPNGVGDQLWSQNSSGILDQCDKDDNLGFFSY